MKISDSNFLEYLSIEEHNLLASINNFRNEFDLFYNLDKIYRAPLSRLEVSEDKAIVPQLYLFVHFHLYFSVSCILRSHLSETLASVRKAIDATLTAYRIILEPETAGEYLVRDDKFQYIKSYIQGERKKDISKFPLAESLIKIHDACSEFGSHADISSFVHRLEIKDIPGTSKDQLLVHYFQFPRQEEEYKFYIIVTLQAFFEMFKVFKIFFDSHLKIIDSEWEGVISVLGPKLEELRKKYHSQIKRG